ncbi:hypothetical protein [Streptomyces sp. NBRC 109706]|uniref:hypothetical protein n=1 Tax=Streptomyces sp. NBRC 109706 TaxID=1550035 RepID=UPI000AE4D745|nr:hypothetical protein [Streptomyces sp. NBRC 109706]
MKALHYAVYLLAGLAAAGAALYVVVYLYRWEWQRALLCGVLLLVIEMFLVGTVVLARLGRLDRRITASHARGEEVLRRLEQSRAEGPARFRWLNENDHGVMVFVPVLMATGAALSGLALLVQKVAAASVRPGAERRLAGRLASLAAPPGGIRGNGPRPAEEPPVPPPRPRRRALVVAGVLVAALATTLLVKAISDATQTRSADVPNAAATTVVFRIEVRNTEDTTTYPQAADALWETCRRAISAPRQHGVLGRLEDDVFVGVLRPPLAAHDMRRLHGCLTDSTSDRTVAHVLGRGQATPEAN